MESKDLKYGDFVKTFMGEIMILTKHEDKEWDYHGVLPSQGGVRIKASDITEVTNGDIWKERAEKNFPIQKPTETENFKRVGDWIYSKGSGTSINIKALENECIYQESEDLVVAGGMFNGIGTVEELLSIL